MCRLALIVVSTRALLSLRPRRGIKPVLRNIYTGISSSSIIWRALNILLIAFSLAALPATCFSGVPKAGSLLTAYVTATYLDPTTGQIRTISSNNAVVTVSQIAGVTLSSGTAIIDAKQNNKACASISVINDGNGKDSFDLSCQCPAEWMAQLYSDINSDGLYQAGEPLSNVASSLEPGHQTKFVLVVTAPPNTQILEGNVEVTALSRFDHQTSGSVSISFNFEPSNRAPELYNPVLLQEGQNILCGITYRDLDGEMPSDGWPVLWVNNPSEKDFEGIVTDIQGNIIIDDTANWTPGQFRGMPVQIESLTHSDGVVYSVIENTEIALFVNGSPQDDGVIPGSQFKLQQVSLKGLGNDYSAGVQYENRIFASPYVSQAHFSVVSQQQYRGQTVYAYARYPESGELSVTVSTPNSGNAPPILRDAVVNPTEASENGSINLSVKYIDANNDPPSVNTERNGYIWAVVNGYPIPFTETAGSNFAEGVTYSLTLENYPIGVHRVYFVASDGKARVRFPENDSILFRVNAKPSLRNPSVTPSVGSEARLFNYSVIYSDPDGTPPREVTLTVDSKKFSLFKDALGGNDYRSGVKYSINLRGRDIGLGSHTFQFSACDGIENALETPVPPLPGPIVTPNTPPVLTNGTCNRSSGTTKTPFKFSVIYQDAEGDPPAYVYAVLSNHQPILLVPESLDGINFQAGVQYSAVAYLEPGKYYYRFETSDSLATVVYPAIGSYCGEIDVYALFETRIVFDKNRYAIGEQCVLSGQIQPAMPAHFGVSLSDPEGVTRHYQINTGADGRFAIDFLPEITGPWYAYANWEGTDIFAPAVAEEWVLVGGPALVTSGLQMIGIPYEPVNKTPLGVFGSNPPFLLARWLPNESRYAVFDTTGNYRSDVFFPEINAGCGYWFGSQQPKLILPVGRLVNQESEYKVQLTAGWNQVGYVFLKPSPWGETKIIADGVEYTLSEAFDARIIHIYTWTYDGTVRSYRVVHPSLPGIERNLQPWRGYWVYAWRNCELALQPPSTADQSLQFAAAEIQPAAQFNGDWQVRISARLKPDNPISKDIDEYSDMDNFIGVTSVPAGNIPSPSYNNGYVDLYFSDYTDLAPSSRYASDFRPASRIGQPWDFLVESDSSGECAISWDGINSIPNIKLILTDMETGSSIEMHKNNRYVYRHKQGQLKPFRISIAK